MCWRVRRRYGVTGGLSGRRPRPEMAGLGVELGPRRRWVAAQPRRRDQPTAFSAAAPLYERHRGPAKKQESPLSMTCIEVFSAALLEPEMPCMYTKLFLTDFRRVHAGCIEALLPAGKQQIYISHGGADWGPVPLEQWLVPRTAWAKWAARQRRCCPWSAGGPAQTRAPCACRTRSTCMAVAAFQVCMQLIIYCYDSYMTFSVKQVPHCQKSA